VFGNNFNQSFIKSSDWIAEVYMSISQGRTKFLRECLSETFSAGTKCHVIGSEHGNRDRELIGPFIQKHLWKGRRCKLLQVGVVCDNSDIVRFWAGFHALNFLGWVNFFNFLFSHYFLRVGWSRYLTGVKVVWLLRKECIFLNFVGKVQ
jgi:hypothetical protein